MSEPSPSLSPEAQQAIAGALSERGVSATCPRCNRARMDVFDTLVAFSVSAQVGAVVLGGQNIPCAILACGNCGWLDFHALGALNMMNHPTLQTQDSE